MAAGKEQKKDRRDEKGIIKENEAGGEAARHKHKSQSRFVRGDTSLVQGRKEGTGAFGWS